MLRPIEIYSESQGRIQFLELHRRSVKCVKDATMHLLLYIELTIMLLDGRPNLKKEKRLNFFHDRVCLRCIGYCEVPVEFQYDMQPKISLDILILLTKYYKGCI